MGHPATPRPRLYFCRGSRGPQAPIQATEQRLRGPDATHLGQEPDHGPSVAADAGRRSLAGASYGLEMLAEQPQPRVGGQARPGWIEPALPLAPAPMRAVSLARVIATILRDIGKLMEPAMQREFRRQRQIVGDKGAKQRRPRQDVAADHPEDRPDGVAGRRGDTG